MQKNWKYYLGMTLFVYSFLPLGIVGILPFMGMELGQAGTFAVVFLASGEMAFWCAATLLGKDFLTALKQRIMAFFKRTHKPKPISRARHRCGLALLIVSTLPYYAMLIYLLLFVHQEFVINLLVWSLVLGEIAFMASLFILGWQFWERLTRLFRWPGNEIENVPC